MIFEVVNSRIYKRTIQIQLINTIYPKIARLSSTLIKTTGRYQGPLITNVLRCKWARIDFS